MMGEWQGLIFFVLSIVGLIAIVAFILIAQKRGFRADLSKVILRDEQRYQRARGVAQELHRMTGDDDRHIQRMIVLLTKGSTTDLVAYMDTIPRPERSQLKKPDVEASLLIAHLEKVHAFTEASMDVLGPEG